MKVFLDDKRQPPEGWVLVRTPEEAIRLLWQEDVEEISLDYHLSLEEGRDGAMVLKWMLRQVEERRITRVPVIHVHTDDPEGREEMEEALVQIRSAIAH
jgi:hypothetical protein